MEKQRQTRRYGDSKRMGSQEQRMKIQNKSEVREEKKKLICILLVPPDLNCELGLKSWLGLKNSFFLFNQHNQLLLLTPRMPEAQISHSTSISQKTAVQDSFYLTSPLAPSPPPPLLWKEIVTGRLGPDLHSYMQGPWLGWYGHSSGKTKTKEKGS